MTGYTDQRSEHVMLQMTKVLCVGILYKEGQCTDCAGKAMPFRAFIGSLGRMRDEVSG